MIPRSELCPLDIQRSLHRYVNEGVPPGDFLQAVLSNDLQESIARADHENCAALVHIVAYCYNHIPSASWGSATNMRLWVERKRLERQSLEVINNNGKDNKDGD